MPPDIRVGTPVSNTALAATILELVGGGEADPFPGPSLKRLWLAPAGGEWPLPLSEMTPQRWLSPHSPAAQGAMKSLVSPDWHFIAHEKLGIGLYAAKSDPEERLNLADQPEARGVVARFWSLLQNGLRLPPGWSRP